MQQVMRNKTQDGVSTGGFRNKPGQVYAHGWVWVCCWQHACLSSVGAADDDHMCYAYHMADGTFHAWGLNSELNLQVCNRGASLAL